METILLDRLATGSPAPPKPDLRRLAAEVILQALKDAGGSNEIARLEARHWLLTGESFPAWATAAGLDWRKARERLREGVPECRRRKVG